MSLEEMYFYAFQINMTAKFGFNYGRRMNMRQLKKLKFIPYEDISKGYEDVMRRIPDDTKIKRLLGVSAKVPLQEGLKETIEWQISVRKNMT